MNGILLLLPVFLPLVLGLLSYFLPIRSESCRRLVYSLLILGTTALAWAAILLCDDGTFTLLHFSHRLTIAFRMDGAARLFAGLSATLWPFTMLYGFDYMRHEKHLHMFWAFFTASFGVTLGIAFSANMMTMYLFYELLTLATLPLVMQPMTKAAKKAGVKYLVYSISGAALAFIGLVFLAIHDAVDFTLGGHLAGYDGDMSMLLAVFALSLCGLRGQGRHLAAARLASLGGGGPHPRHGPAPRGGGGKGRRLRLHPPDLLQLRPGHSVRYLGPAAGAAAAHHHHCLRLLHVPEAAALQAAAGLLHGVEPVVYSVCRRPDDHPGPGSVLPAPDRPLGGKDHGLLHGRCGAALRPPGVCAPAGGPGPVHAGDLRLLHGGGLRSDGDPPFNGFVSKWYIARAAVDIGGWLPLVGLAALLVSALLTAVYMFQVVLKAWFPGRAPPPSPRAPLMRRAG